jgi:hypothetical protein
MRRWRLRRRRAAGRPPSALSCSRESTSAASCSSPTPEAVTYGLRRGRTSFSGSRTRWRSEIDSNSRSRWLSAEGADRRDFPFSSWETDRDQRRSAVPEKDRPPAAKRAMCVSAQRCSGQAPVSDRKLPPVMRIIATTVSGSRGFFGSFTLAYASYITQCMTGARRSHENDSQSAP